MTDRKPKWALFVSMAILVCGCSMGRGTPLPEPRRPEPQPEPLPEPLRTKPSGLDPEEVEAFSRRLSDRGDPKLVRFAKEMRTLAGRIALAERTAAVARELEVAARKRALDDDFQAHFVKDKDSYILRKGKDRFRRTLIEDYRTYESHMRTLKPRFDAIARELVAKPYINVDLRKFLETEAAAHVFYNLVRPYLTPGVDPFDLLDKYYLKAMLFVRDDGKRQLLGRFLKEAGFSNVRETSFRCGTDPRLCLDLEERRGFTLYMEGQKG